MITETTDYAQGLRKVFKEEFEKAGGQIVADETFNSDLLSQSCTAFNCAQSQFQIDVLSAPMRVAIDQARDIDPDITFEQIENQKAYARNRSNSDELYFAATAKTGVTGRPLSDHQR